MDLYEKVMRAATLDSTVLILGASTAARNLVAQILHNHGPRKNGPFICLNRAAVPAQLADSEVSRLIRGASTACAGSFAQADGGTLCIDEIDRLTPDAQEKLLRAVETATVTPFGGSQGKDMNVRIVSGTSSDIERMAHGGDFNETLYYRLNVVTLDLRGT